MNRRRRNARENLHSTQALGAESNQHVAGSTLQPLIRLDSPRSGSSILSNEMTIRGWAFLTPAVAKALRAEAVALEIICEELKNQPTVLFAGLTCAADVLGTETRAHSAKVTSLHISDIGRHVPGESERFGALAYHLTAVLDVSEFVPENGQMPRLLCLRLLIRTEEHLCISNTAHVAIQPRSNWSEAFGGFLFPSTGLLCSDLLLLAGWGLRRNDRPKRISLLVRDQECLELARELPSPLAADGLPDIEEALRCGFGSVLQRHEAMAAGLLTGRGNEYLLPDVRIRFESGQTQRNTARSLRWIPWRDTDGNYCGLIGRIETFREVDDNLLSLEGWITALGFERPRLFLEARSWRLELVEGETIFWHERADISQAYPLQAGTFPAGFVLRIHPHALGDAPGMVRLVAELSDGTRCELAPGSFCRLLSRQIFARRSRTAMATARALAALAVSAVGIRTQLHQSRSSDAHLLPQQDSPQRILFVSHNLTATEGAPKVLLQIVDGFLKRGMRAENLSVVSAVPGELERDYDRLGVPVTILPGLATHGLSWERYFQSLSSAHSELQAFRPDIVFANSVDSFWGVDWAFRNQLPSVWAIHESLTPAAIHAELDPRLRLLLLDRLAFVGEKVFVSETTRQLYASLMRPDTTRVIANSIDIDFIRKFKRENSREKVREKLGLEKHQFVVSIIGTTTPRKGQDIFLREMKVLVSKHPQKSFCFYVVGGREGEFLEVLTAMSREYDIAQLVTIVPETRDVGAYYLASDAVVIASREESAPLVSLETFAYEVPLVSTNVFGLSELLVHEQNALVFNGAEFGELAEQLGRLLAPGKLREELVHGGLDSLRREHRPEQQLERYLQTLQDVFQRSRRSKIPRA